MLFFLAARLHLDMHAVAIESAHERGNRVATRHRGLAVDRRTKYAAGADAVVIGCRHQARLVVQLRNLAVDIRIHGECKITLFSFRLTALLAVRAVVAVGIEDSCGQ
jgi:hypothetical protein